MTSDTSRPPRDDHDDLHQEMWLEPAARLTGSGRERLGVLGSIDPRLLSVGAIAVAAALVVPLLGAVRVATTATTASARWSRRRPPPRPWRSTAAPTTAAEIVVTAAVNPDQVESEPAELRGRHRGAVGLRRLLVGAAAGEQGGDQAVAVAALRTPEGCGNLYDVVAGDFWLGIAQKADVELDELLAANDASARRRSSRISGVPARRRIDRIRRFGRR